jgi:hypothetical protein
VVVESRSSAGCCSVVCAVDTGVVVELVFAVGCMQPESAAIKKTITRVFIKILFILLFLSVIVMSD